MCHLSRSNAAILDLCSEVWFSTATYRLLVNVPEKEFALSPPLARCQPLVPSTVITTFVAEVVMELTVACTKPWVLPVCSIESVLPLMLQVADSKS